MKKDFKFSFTRIIIIVFLMVIQLGLIAVVVLKLSQEFVYLYGFFIVLSLAVVLVIISRNINPSYKLAWIIPVLVFPIFGGLFYLIFGGKRMNKKFKKTIATYYKGTDILLKQDNEVLNQIKAQSRSIYNTVNYISKYASSPIYSNTLSKYLSPGEVFYDELIEQLKLAKKYIFIECFIIHEGVMWDTILELLQDKAREGVDVRIIYDDAGCITTLPSKYYDTIRSLNIKCVVFNKFVPVLSAVFNNRDHRKITIIDGHTAFTGGINLSDEYINQVIRFGYFKDAAIMIRGEAVWNFTVMFLQMWASITDEFISFAKYKPGIHYEIEFESDGYVQPYGDNPFDDELVGENVYLNIINKAKEYVYICTPYLIIDNELVTALTLAAKNGLDVRIVTPHIEDKPYIHVVTRSYYSQLISAGIRIYEYTPGFIHSKTFVSDDVIGVVGTINMDYRSLYLHFECGVFLYKTKSIEQMKQDFINILAVSQEIKIEDTKNVGIVIKIVRLFLRAFAPLM